MAKTTETKAPEPATTGRKRAPENETGREKFKRVAGGRLLNATSAMELLGQVGLSKEYEYGQDDIDVIRTKFEAAFKKMMTQLTQRSAQSEKADLFK